MIKINHEITKENLEKLKDVYKFVYICNECSLKYGSDKKETQPHLCPLCEKK